MCLILYVNLLLMQSLLVGVIYSGSFNLKSEQKRIIQLKGFLFMGCRQEVILPEWRGLNLVNNLPLPSSDRCPHHLGGFCPLAGLAPTATQPQAAHRLPGHPCTCTGTEPPAIERSS